MYSKVAGIKDQNQIAQIRSWTTLQQERIIKHVNGIIFRPAVYELCKNKQDLSDAINELMRNSAKYLSYEKWFANRQSIVGVDKTRVKVRELFSSKMTDDINSVLTSNY